MAKAKPRSKMLPPKERKQQIIAATLECLSEHGHAKLTARKIAAESGVSLGNITYHFKDMREILVETYRYASHRLLEATERELMAHQDTPEAKLRAFLGAGFTDELLSKAYIAVRIDLWSAALRYDELKEVENELYQAYRDQLSTLVLAVRDDLRSDTQQIVSLVDLIMATLDGLWLDWARRKNLASLRGSLNALMRLIITGCPH